MLLALLLWLLAYLSFQYETCITKVAGVARQKKRQLGSIFNDYCPPWYTGIPRIKRRIKDGWVKRYLDAGKIYFPSSLLGVFVAWLGRPVSALDAVLHY